MVLLKRKGMMMVDNQKLKALLEELDIMRMDGVYAIEEARTPLEHAMALSRHTAAKAALDAFYNLFPEVSLCSSMKEV